VEDLPFVSSGVDQIKLPCTNVIPTERAEVRRGEELKRKKIRRVQFRLACSVYSKGVGSVLPKLFFSLHIRVSTVKQMSENSESQKFLESSRFLALALVVGQ